MAAYFDESVGTQAVDRDKLYEQLWSIPASRLAIQYGISDVGLAKVCKRYNIPHPPRGYWAKLQAGKRVRRAPLPKLEDPRDQTVYMKGWKMPAEVVQAAIADNEATVAAEEPVKSKAARPLLDTTRQQLEAALPDGDGLLRSDPATGLDVRVSARCIERAMHLFGLFIEQWLSLGGDGRPGSMDGDDAGGTNIWLGDDWLTIRLEENLDSSRPVTDEGYRTGNLCFWIDGGSQRQFRRRWSDTKSQRLERAIKPMVDTLLIVLGEMKIERLDRECEARQKQQLEARRRAEEQDQSNRFYEQQELLQAVDRWHNAQRIRQYLAAVQAGLDAGTHSAPDVEAFERWMQWAASYADSLDPLTDPGPATKEQAKPANVPIGQIDFTSRARSTVEALGAIDSDDLWSRSEDEVRTACPGWAGPTWDELTRVLEILGYDVSHRKERANWW